MVDYREASTINIMDLSNNFVSGTIPHYIEQISSYHTNSFGFLYSIDILIMPYDSINRFHSKDIVKHG